MIVGVQRGAFLEVRLEDHLEDDAEQEGRRDRDPFHLCSEELHRLVTRLLGEPVVAACDPPRPVPVQPLQGTAAAHSEVSPDSKPSLKREGGGASSSAPRS